MGPKVLLLPGTCCLTLIAHGLCLGCFGCLKLFLAGSYNNSFLESWLHLWLHSHIFVHCHLRGYPRDPDSLPGFRPLWPRNLCSMYRKAITQLISRSATCSTSSQIFLDFSMYGLSVSLWLNSGNHIPGKSDSQGAPELSFHLFPYTMTGEV